MFKKKKSNTRYKADYKLHLQVSSPRIVFFQSLKVLRGVLKVSILLGLLGAAGFYGYSSIQNHFLTSEEFALRHLELQTNGFLDKSEVAQISGIDPAGTIFGFDPNEAEQRLLARPEIVTATVQRSYPDTVKVTIVERVPVAWIASPVLGLAGRNPFSGRLMDADGVIFKCQGQLWEIARNLPVIALADAQPHEFELGQQMTHKDAMRALALVKLINATSDIEWWVNRVEVINFYSLQVISNDKVEAIFGMYEHERQLDDLIAARKHAVESKRELEWINLLPKHNVPGRFKTPSALSSSGVKSVKTNLEAAQ